MDEVLSVKADEDTSAKEALWQAIQLLAQELKAAWNLDTYLQGKGTRPLTILMPRPDEHLWKLVEILSVLTVLKDADQVLSSSVHNLLGRIPEPVAFIKRAEPCYLWTQRAMGQSRSGFAGVPDITVTSTADVPSRANALDVIEVKSGPISSRLIRQEFAKGYDLKIKSYCIWSYQQPTKAQIDGARVLGIDLEPLGFDAPEDVRQKRLDPRGLIAQFSNVLTERRDFSRFEIMLTQSASESNDKRWRSVP
jgi:hypothetical protein